MDLRKKVSTRRALVKIIRARIAAQDLGDEEVEGVAVVFVETILLPADDWRGLEIFFVVTRVGDVVGEKLATLSSIFETKEMGPESVCVWAFLSLSNKGSLSL
ncbi:hypothetical protein M0804_003532 [Polistes exclamans]|nr:hypothetical protein M0804_003532 [Polistes exclamans]